MQQCCVSDFITIALQSIFISMILIYSLLLFLLTFAGGSFPLWNRNWDEQKMKYLLAFSGSFLLGITLLHLIPEIFETTGRKAGFYILLGFFLQQVIQRFTHGVEHGHHHLGEHHHVSIWPIFAGLGFHALSEGLPLGIPYTDPNTLPSLFIAIAFHKLPEAMLITSLIIADHRSHKRKAWLLLLIFALLTPVSGLFTHAMENVSNSFAAVVPLFIPIIAGSFIHISTTIFFESGTKSHEMNIRKWTAILLGVGFAMLTLLGDSH
jgi:zinc and cadmium transporter